MYNKDFDIWGRVKSALGGKVDKQKGKGLSTNDYTTEDKTKVESLSTISNAEIDILFSRRENENEYTFNGAKSFS